VANTKKMSYIQKHQLKNKSFQPVPGVLQGIENHVNKKVNGAC